MSPPRTQRGKSLAQRVLTVFGAAGLLGAAAPVVATLSTERALLEWRVAQVRNDLARTPPPATPALTVAGNNWNNWPNWSNWAKWANR
jgi:hypothetical protein